MNIYRKYAPNVFVAECTEKHEKGDSIMLTTKYGKENECIVFNFLGTIGDKHLYSIVRADGFDHQEWAKRKADRLLSAASNAENKSMDYHKASNKHSDFLSLGEPIKVGHHSERRHRRIIEQAQNNTGKSIEYSKKADDYAGRAEYWERKATEINLSMPESVEYYEYKLEKAKKVHAGLKDGTIERRHSFSLTYAKKDVNEAEKNLKLAMKLWGESA